MSNFRDTFNQWEEKSGDTRPAQNAGPRRKPPVPNRPNGAARNANSTTGDQNAENTSAGGGAKCSAPPVSPRRNRPLPPRGASLEKVAPEMAYSTFRPVTNTPQQSCVPDKAEQNLTKMRKTRKAILEELINTERSYVESLFLIEQLYIKPLRAAISNGNAIIQEDDIGHIFSHIDTMMNISRKLLQGLRARLQEWDDNTCVGDILMALLPFMKMYSEYQVQYKTGMELVISLKETNVRFDEFCLQCLQDPRSNNLDLLAYLIMPVQRIPRYLLLLENLVKNTWDEHPDYPQLCDAKELVRSVAGHVDAKDADKMQKMYTLQAMVGGETLPIIQPWRTFVGEKHFKVLIFEDTGKGKPWELVMHLLSDIIIFTSSKSRGKAKLKGRVRLCYSWIWDAEIDADYDGPANTIVLFSPLSTFHIQCGSEEEKTDWLAQLGSAIDSLWETDHISRDRRGRVTGIISSQGPDTDDAIPSPDQKKRRVTVHEDDGRQYEWDPMAAQIVSGRQICLLADLIDIDRIEDEKDDERFRTEVMEEETEETETAEKQDKKRNGSERNSSATKGRVRALSKKKVKVINKELNREMKKFEKLEKKNKSEIHDGRPNSPPKRSATAGGTKHPHSYAGPERSTSDPPAMAMRGGGGSYASPDRRGTSPRREGSMAGNSVSGKTMMFEDLNRADEYVKSGMLTKKGGVRKNWKLRWWILDQDAMRYYTSSIASKPVGCIFLKGCIVKPTSQIQKDSSDPVFELVAPHRTFYLKAKTNEEKLEWINAIEAQLKILKDVYVRVGFLTKQGRVRKNWKRRYCILDERCLKYFKAPSDAKPAGEVEVLNSFVDWSEDREMQHQSGRGRTIRIVTPTRTLFVYGDNEKESLEWLDTLRIVSRQFERSKGERNSDDTEHPLMYRKSTKAQVAS